jgi:hypothetical protein
MDEHGVVAELREKERELREKMAGKKDKGEKDSSKDKSSIKDVLATSDHFITGILYVNDRFQHNFFDVKVMDFTFFLSLDFVFLFFCFFSFLFFLFFYYYYCMSSSLPFL